MKYSNFTSRIAGDGADAWKIHDRAVELQGSGKDIIMVSIGEPDFETPGEIVEAAVDSLRAGQTHYPEFAGIPELREVIASKHEQQTGQAVGPDNVVILAGAQNALYAAAHCLLDVGDEVIVPEPTYVTYEGVLGAVGARTVSVPMDPNNGFRLDPANIEAAVTGRTKAIMLNSPHNPTGVCLSKGQVAAIADICVKHDLWLISDEVYGSLVFEGEHNSIACVPGIADRTVVINSLSKSHAMTGWRLGWLIGPQELINHVTNMVTAMLYGTPSFIQYAAITALTTGESASNEMRDTYRDRRDQVYERLNQVPGLKCHLPDGGMFMMVDIRESKLSAQAFSEYLLEQYGVSALAGEAFGPSAAGHLRISLGVPNKVLHDACNRIAACFEEVTSVPAITSANF